jgi:metal-dependent amidase/aminoacylase/carboxypeptidase family protein
MNLEKLVHNSIDNLKEKAFELNDYIYNNPELATSFKATINEDKNSDIKIRILAEYDALPEIGHACGHCANDL